MSTFTLQPRGPFSLARAADVVAHFPPLRHQPAAGAEVRLGFVLDREHAPVAVSLRDVGGVVHGRFAGSARVEAVRAQVARILSLDHDATSYPDVARRDPALAPLMSAFEGLRPVCFTSPYEAACWAVVSQRIRKEQAARLHGEIVRTHGHTVELDGQTVNVFPRPERLVERCDVPGLPVVKRERLRAIAAAALEGALDAETLRALGDEEAPRRLLALPGIGAFWASGVYLRGCGVRDVFPDEPMSIAALGALHPGFGGGRARELIDAYRPFRMFVCFLLRVAAARGVLDVTPQAPRPLPVRTTSGSRSAAWR